MNRAEDIFLKIKKEGAKAIDEFILTQQSEELFLDFKRSANNGDSTFISDKDRLNLSKAISGFANSEGGVIVWGIECKREVDGSDLPKTKFPIKNVKRFVSFLENAISGCTIPPHSKIQNHALVIDKSGNGFAITLIPKSDNAPFQALFEKRYYIRAGSNFSPIPHDLLAGLFGRRPQPNVYNMFIHSPAEITGNTIKISLGFMLHNGGRVLARDLFLSIWIMSSPGINCTIGLKQNDKSWSGYWAFERNYHTVSTPTLRLPPDSGVEPVVGEIIFKPPFTNRLKINITCGCEGGMLYKATLEHSAESIKKVFNEIINKNSINPLTIEERKKVVTRLMGNTITE